MVVEVDGFLDEPEPETVQTKVEIVLRVVDRRRHVMET
jgi:hypothetical protein